MCWARGHVQPYVVEQLGAYLCLYVEECEWTVCGGHYWRRPERCSVSSAWRGAPGRVQRIYAAWPTAGLSKSAVLMLSVQVLRFGFFVILFTFIRHHSLQF